MLLKTPLGFSRFAMLSPSLSFLSPRALSLALPYGIETWDTWGKKGVWLLYSQHETLPSGKLGVLESAGCLEHSVTSHAS